MNLILLSSSDFIKTHSYVSIAGRRHRHVLEILKPVVGDVLTVGMEGGRIGEGRVIRLDGKSLEMDVVLTKDPPPKLPLVLCVALMRPIVLKRVLQTASAMGVAEIHLFHSRQVEKSFWQSTALKSDAVREELALGLEQARDTILPEIHFHKRFKPFVEDVLPVLLKRKKGIVADPSGDVLDVRGGTPGQTVLLIGPEGGFIPYEVEKFREAGCRVVGLGERILKVETAIVSLIAKLF